MATDQLTTPPTQPRKPKMNLRLITTALVAVAGAFVAQSAHAGTYTGASGDLILSFESSTTGDNNDLMVDLGPGSGFAANTPFSLDLSADLVAQFGATWYMDSNLIYSIAGGSGAGGQNPILYASDPTTTPFTSESTASSLSGDINKVNAVLTPSSPTAGLSPTPYTDGGVDVVAKASSNSYHNASPTGTYGALSATSATSIQNQMALDVEKKSGSSVLTTDVFTVTAAGLVTFGPALVPEPSTYALMIFGGALLIFALRRKSASSL